MVQICSKGCIYTKNYLHLGTLLISLIEYAKFHSAISSGSKRTSLSRSPRQIPRPTELFLDYPDTFSRLSGNFLDRTETFQVTHTLFRLSGHIFQITRTHFQDHSETFQITSTQFYIIQTLFRLFRYIFQIIRILFTSTGKF